MYLGKERRNRFVALGLAAVLVAGVVLALLATVAAAAPVVGGGVVRDNRWEVSGSRPGAAPSPGRDRPAPVDQSDAGTDFVTGVAL